LVAQLQLFIYNKINNFKLKLKLKNEEIEVKDEPNDAVCAATDGLKRRNVVGVDFENVA